MTDILNQIDKAIARNAVRFDPFGPPPRKSGIEEEAVEPEAVVEAPPRVPFSLPPEDYVALYGRSADEFVEPEPTYHRYECPHSHCDWAKIALDRDVLLDLAEAHELKAHARPRWLRWLPGGKR